MSMVRVGIVAALPREVRCFLGGRRPGGDPVALGTDTLLRLSGIGRERAGAAARDLRDRGVRALVSWGFAGGLRPGLRSGALLIPASVQAADGRTFTTDPAWRRRIADAVGGRATVSAAPVVESLVPLLAAADKARSHQRFRAEATDMESAAVGAVAERAGLPFLVVRAVCDDAALDLPALVLATVDEFGGPRVGAALLAVLRHPGEGLRVVRVWAAARAAAATLREVARCAGSALAAP